MSRELDRHRWDRLHSAGSAGGVPAALRKLSQAGSEEVAREAYWAIDNTVIVQGWLYEAACVTVPCVLAVLQAATDASRPRLLELLVQIGAGEAPEKSDLHRRCLIELLRGTALYFHLLETGSLDEKTSCVDLLGMCARLDRSLRERVTWHLRALAGELREQGLKGLVAEWLEELEGEAG